MYKEPPKLSIAHGWKVLHCDRFFFGARNVSISYKIIIIEPYCGPAVHVDGNLFELVFGHAVATTLTRATTLARATALARATTLTRAAALTRVTALARVPVCSTQQISEKPSV
jgi:hypothetical protein